MTTQPRLASMSSLRELRPASLGRIDTAVLCSLTASAEPSGRPSAVPLITGAIPTQFPPLSHSVPLVPTGRSWVAHWGPLGRHWVPLGRHWVPLGRHWGPPGSGTESHSIPLDLAEASGLGLLEIVAHRRRYIRMNAIECSSHRRPPPSIETVVDKVAAALRRRWRLRRRVRKRRRQSVAGATALRRLQRRLL